VFITFDEGEPMIMHVSYSSNQKTIKKLL